MSNSAYKSVFSAVIETLSRSGVYVGSTSFYPRVEVHSVTETLLEDKGHSVRRVNLTIETMTTTSIGDCENIHSENLRRMQEFSIADGSGFSLLGCIPTSTRDMQESTDTQAIIYRLMSDFEIFVEQI